MWTLLLSRRGDPPGTFLDRRQIDSGQIKVGRGAATCDLVVPDTSGQLSREHCLISAIGFDLFVVDTSTNGVALNQPGQRIAPQQPVAIRIGDRLLLGDFVIEVANETAGLGAPLQAAASMAPAPQTLQQPDAWFDTSPGADPIWGGGASRQQVHDFLGDAMHDFLATPAPAAGGPAASFDPLGGVFGEAFSKPLLGQAIEAVAPDFAIPEDWDTGPAAAPDPFAAGFGAARPDPLAAFPPPPSPDPLAATPSPSPFTGDPFADFPAKPAASDDPFADFPVPSPTPPKNPFADAPGAPAASADPFADFSPAPFAPPDPFAGFADAADRKTSPPIATPTAPEPPAAPPTGAAPGAPDWGAFCEGAGIDPADLRTSPDAMRRLGVLYRQVVLGLSDLIQDRAAFKDEFRVERTQLSFGRNNPLKHLAPIESAKLLLAAPLPGFMDAEEAVRAGLEDVKRHQLALLAGVQHALKAVFARLSPTEVERVMKTATAKRGLLGRGVDPWSVYRTMWEALRTDAESNVNSVMSVAFREGYEAFMKSGKGAA